MAEFEQIKQSCSKSYSLEILSTDGEERWQALRDEEASVLTVNQANGSIEIGLRARKLDGQSWKIKYTVINSAGN